MSRSNPSSLGTSNPELADTLARRAVARSVADRTQTYAAEMQRIVDATYGLIERTGQLSPSLRDILAATNLSTQAFYRYFQSKDELMLLLLDDGRRKLLEYLEHRMAKVERDQRVRAWIQGVLAQAANAGAAARTRPFLAHQDRLAELFPAEQQQSVDLLVDQLAGAVRLLDTPARSSRQARRDAECIYELAFGVLHRHLTRQTAPSAAEIDHLVDFAV
ncbi:MAG TPA: TetR/AcrR family transcriptional regulator, partial [Acidimicrobiia bacterium]